MIPHVMCVMCRAVCRVCRVVLCVLEMARGLKHHWFDEANSPQGTARRLHLGAMKGHPSAMR